MNLRASINITTMGTEIISVSGENVHAGVHIRLMGIEIVSVEYLLGILGMVPKQIRLLCCCCRFLEPYDEIAHQ